MKYLKKGIIRAIIPFVIMTGISCLLYFVENNAKDAQGVFFVGLIITSVSGFTVLYEIEKWSLLKQSMIHFICMLLTVFPCLIFSGFYKTETFVDYLYIFGTFIAFGIVLWLIGFLVFGKLLNKPHNK